MSNQDNINSFLDSMDFDSTPAAGAPNPQSVPFTPAAVWPGEEPTQQTAAAAPVQAEPVPAAPPTAQPAAPQEVMPTPAPAVQTPQTPQSAPAIQRQVIPQQQPVVQQQVVPTVQPVVQQQPVAQPQPAIQPAAPEPAPVQETMLDKFDMVMQNLEAQGEKRMLEALAAKPAIFSYAKVKENIDDRDSTFEDLRQKYEADFPELSDPKTISWTVNYGKTTKSVNNPGSDKVYDIKAEIENSKAFKEALKKAKTDAEKNPECIVKLFKKAQSKGEALSGIKELCLTKAEAAQTNKPIVLLPSKDGRVYEQRRNEIGCFTAPAENVREFEDIRAEFKMALPKIPAHIFSKVMGFFKSISDELHYEVLVHILYDTEEKEYIIKVPKQRISEASVNSETDEPYLKGEDVTRDIDRADELLRRCADRGNKYAEYTLGKALLDGELLPQDIPEAVRLLTTSAEQGFPNAEYILGKLYYKGEIVPADLPKAIDLLERATEKGNPYVAYLAGKLRLTEDEVKDIEKAIRNFEIAAANGNDFAEYQLGKIYLYGRDTEQDMQKALEWLESSAEHGNQYALQMLHSIRNNRNISAATGIIRLLHHVSRIIGERMEADRKDGSSAVDRKLKRRIDEKKQAQGIKD